MTVPVCPWPTEPCISGTLVTLACELPATHPACQKLPTMVGHLQTAHAPLGKHRHSLSLVRCDPPLPHSRHVAATLRSSFSSFIAIPTRPVCFNNSSPSFHFSPTIYMFDTYVDFSTTFYTQCSQLVIKEFKWSARVCGAAAILQLRL